MGHKCVIEFDGEQHFNPDTFFSKRSDFKQNKKRDLTKTRYALENNLYIARIPYSFLQETEQAMEQLLKILENKTINEPSMFLYCDENLYRKHMKIAIGM
jgi:very-short-patch-repair endonuclease